MIDATFIKAISELGIQAASATPKELHWRSNVMPRGEWYRWDHLKREYERLTEPVQDVYQMTTLASVADWCNMQRRAGHPVDVFVTPTNLTAFVKNPTGSKVFINFAFSNANAWFMDTAKEEETVTQKEFLKLANTRLRSVITDFVVAQFRKMKWTHKVGTDNNLQAGKANLGRDLEAEITGEVPDFISCSCPVLDNPTHAVGNFNYSISVTKNLEEMNFSLYVSPDAVSNMKHTTAAALAARLRVLLGEEETPAVVVTSATALTAATRRREAGAGYSGEGMAPITIYHGLNATPV